MGNRKCNLLPSARNRLIIRVLTNALLLGLLMLYCLLLIGCVTPSTPFYLFEIFTQTLGSTEQISLKVGYFGICADAPHHLACASSVASSPASMVAQLSSMGANFPDSAAATALFDTAMVLQTKIFLKFLAGAGVVLVLALILLALIATPCIRLRLWTWGALVPIKAAVFLLARVSTALTLIAAGTTAQAVGGLQIITTQHMHSDMAISAGTLLQVLQWVTVAVSAIYSTGLWIVCFDFDVYAKDLPDVEKATQVQPQPVTIPAVPTQATGTQAIGTQANATRVRRTLSAAEGKRILRNWPWPAPHGTDCPCMQCKDFLEGLLEDTKEAFEAERMKMARETTNLKEEEIASSDGTDFASIASS